MFLTKHNTSLISKLALCGFTTLSKGFSEATTLFIITAVLNQFKIIIILITTFHSVSVTNKPQSVSNVAYNFPGTHNSYSATRIRNLATQQTWLDCFFGFGSLAVQRLPKFFIPTFPVPRFLLPRYISVTSTLNIAFI